MTAADLEDPFALPAESRVTARESILSAGRYMLPWKDGSHKSRGFQRVSNLVSAFSDQFGLRMWELGEVLQGVAGSTELYATLLAAELHKMDRPTRKAWVERFIEEAKDVSGGNHGSKHGSQRHAVVEEHHAGLPTGHHGADVRRDLSLYRYAMHRNQLVAQPDLQEKRVLVEELEVVGTLDNVVQDMRTSWLHIADLKTQRKFWTFLEIAAQLACYAHGDAMWDESTGTWVDMPEVDQSVAMVLWMPRKPDDPEELAVWEPRVDVYEVDIVAGWKTAQLAHQVVKDRAAGKAARNPRGWLRKAPEATAWERMAARFAACDSLADGRRLVEEAKSTGVWDATMARCAQAARARIAVPA